MHGKLLWVTMRTLFPQKQFHLVAPTKNALFGISCSQGKWYPKCKPWSNDILLPITSLGVRHCLPAVLNPPYHCPGWLLLVHINIFSLREQNIQLHLINQFLAFWIVHNYRFMVSIWAIRYEAKTSEVKDIGLFSPQSIHICLFTFTSSFHWEVQEQTHKTKIKIQK